MVLDRHNTSSVRNYFSQVFGLERSYLLARKNIDELSGFRDNPPAGVVSDELTPQDRERIQGFVNGLEHSLLVFEKQFPYDLASQEDIANLLMDVRCYIDSQKRE